MVILIVINNKSNNTTFFPKEKKDISYEMIPSVTHEGKPIDGGILNVALVKDEPFQGVFSWELYEDGYDADLLSFTSNSIFEVDENFKINDKGIATLKVDPKQNKVTITIRDGVKWSDGEPLKIEDIILPYLIIGHPDYTGVRYNSSFQNIVGAQSYHLGKTNTISGLKKIDERTLEIQFKKLSPAIYYGGDGLWSYAAPSHQLGKIPVGKLIESDAVRKNPVTLGPFTIKKIVPGETVQYEKNKYYWKGEPKLDGVIVQIVPSSSISMAIKSGKYDIVYHFNAAQFQEIEKLSNTTILAKPELYYSYLGFKLGKFDREKNEVVPNLETSKMKDIRLRQAMGFALDVEQVNEVFYFNLRTRANSLIPPSFHTYHDKSLEGYTFNPTKAKQLLDEAGFHDIDGDGFRENPEGEKLVINLAAIGGDSIQEDIIAYYIQNWKDVGLNVKLVTGRLMDFHTFYEKVKADNSEIDVFMGAWGTGTNPSPSGLYGKYDEYNFSRYTSSTLQKIIEDIDSVKAFNEQYRASKFRLFQNYMNENAPIIPLQYRYELIPINKRVKHFSIDDKNPTELHEIELVKEKPIKSN